MLCSKSFSPDTTGECTLSKDTTIDSKNLALSFWYHLYSERDFNTLKQEINNKIIWEQISGRNFSEWYQVEVPLEKGEHKVIIKKSHFE